MVRIEQILDKVLEYNPKADLDIIKAANVFGAKAHEGQVRESGEVYFCHPLEVANILADLRTDEAAIATGLLHDTVELTKTTIDDIREIFGEEIAFLVDGVTNISKLEFGSIEEAKAENFRRIILAMTKDLRVILVKLADRLHNMRTLQFKREEARLRIAKETLDIYAPIANRLGIGWLKSELEDLSLKYVDPEGYRIIDEYMKEKRQWQDKYMAEVAEVITTRLKKAGIDATVKGRIKHYYSIYKKMKSQGIGIDDIFDIIAFRIITETVRECYEALGIIHSLWPPVPERIKDFIVLPKSNMYQSLHTSVIGPYGVRIEIQIRTREMDRVAENGIAAHWHYKEGKRVFDSSDRVSNWLRQLVEFMQEVSDPRDFLEVVRIDLFPDEVYVFTPKGDVKALPKGSTPVDFAYSIHTDLGNHCAGAKVNGRVVPLDYQLKNGDRVEIITSSTKHPTRDWLKFVATARARTKIRQWLRKAEKDEALAIGRDMCEREFKKHRLNFSELAQTDEMQKIAEELSYKTVEDLIAGVGYGKVSAKQVANHFLPEEREKEGLAGEEEAPPREKKGAVHGIRVRGVDNLLVRFGKCCHPLPGEKVKGYITRGRGITIHRADCPNILGADPERIEDVEWEDSGEGVSTVRLKMVCDSRPGLLASISSSFSEKRVNISSASIHSKDDETYCTFTIEVKNLQQLREVLKSVRKIKGVNVVERLL